MAGFLLRKTGAAVLVVFVASVIVFAAVRAVPGDPATVMSGDDPTLIPYYRHLYGLDRPLPVQYVKWFSQTLQGNLGRTHSGLPVATVIEQRIPLTLELATMSLLLAILIGVPAGVIAAVRRGKAGDYGTTRRSSPTTVTSTGSTDRCPCNTSSGSRRRCRGTSAERTAGCRSRR